MNYIKKYEYTTNNLLQVPNNYQYSDVSDDHFLTSYVVQREDFIKTLEVSYYEELQIMLDSIAMIEYSQLLKLQKKFEVKKRFFTQDKENISFMVYFSNQLDLVLKQQFCYSLFSTFLKVNDTLTSMNVDVYSLFEQYILKNCIKDELTYYQGLHNA